MNKDDNNNIILYCVALVDDIKGGFNLIRYGDKRKRLGRKTTALQDNLFVRSIFLRPLGPPSTHWFLSLPLQTNRTFHW